MEGGSVELVILGIAQDGGIPQAGCDCPRCMEALRDPKRKLWPVSCAIIGGDGSVHLIEASRALPEQLDILANSLDLDSPVIPDSVSLTHTHMGHIDGLAQFGKEAMGLRNIPLFGSEIVLDVIGRKGLAGPFERKIARPLEPLSPTQDCEFELVFIPVPHRDEESDTHCIIIKGPSKNVLFLPDHDDWGGTLEEHGEEGVRQWMTALGVDIAFIDGTFWDESELGDRDFSLVPHPTISETLDRIGVRENDDPRVLFIHMNHTNPVIDLHSDERATLHSMGWEMATQGMLIRI